MIDLNKLLQTKLLQYQKHIFILESSILSLSKNNVTTTDLTFKIVELQKKINIIKNKYYKNINIISL